METHVSEIRSAGWTLIPEVIPEDFLSPLREALGEAYVQYREIQLKKNIQFTAGTCHHIVFANQKFMDALEVLAALPILTHYFRGKFILNSFGGVINTRENFSYVGQVHRDLRSFSDGFPLMANILVMLDDFTEQNGATHFLSGSHNEHQKPSNDVFFKNSQRAIGKAGDVVVFDSNLWHAAGVNQTDAHRRALTLTFTKPFMKQQLDYPRMFGYEKASSLSPLLRQVVGFNARVPSNLDEWYQAPENRFYLPDQD